MIIMMTMQHTSVYEYMLKEKVLNVNKQRKTVKSCILWCKKHPDLS